MSFNPTSSSANTNRIPFPASAANARPWGNNTPTFSSESTATNNEKQEKHFLWRSFLFNTASIILGGGLLIGIPAFLFRKRLGTMWEQIMGLFSLPAPWVSAFRLARERKWPEVFKAIRRGQEEFFYDASTSQKSKKMAEASQEAGSPEGFEALKAFQQKIQPFLKLSGTIDKLQQEGLEENLLQLNRNLGNINGLLSELKRPEQLKALNNFIASMPSAREVREMTSMARQVSRSLPGSWIGYFMGLKARR